VVAVTARLKAWAKLAAIAVVGLVVLVMAATQPEHSVGLVKDALGGVKHLGGGAVQWAKDVANAFVGG
jgi:hypothetical protein